MTAVSPIRAEIDDSGRLVRQPNAFRDDVQIQVLREWHDAPHDLCAFAVFAHRLEGGAPAVEVLRGLLLGLFGFAGFFVVVGGSIERVGVAPAFAAAVAVALTLQAGSLRLVLDRR